MSTIKRYVGMAVIHPSKKDGRYKVRTEEDPNGDWVQWKDYESLLEELKWHREEARHKAAKNQQMFEFICECVRKGDFKVYKNGGVHFGKGKR